VGTTIDKPAITGAFANWGPCDLRVSPAP
jgi:hypothetical protein